MAKLYFRYGAMGSSKTANAIMVQYNYQERGQTAIMLKPQLDSRDGERIVASRSGLTAHCHFVEELDALDLTAVACIIVDEAQFLTKAQVEKLVEVVDTRDISVICYGLRADFQGNLFEGSHWLLAWADTIEEIKTVCWCGHKAITNARIVDGKVAKAGAQIVLGGNESYVALCRKHWAKGELAQVEIRRISAGKKTYLPLLLEADPSEQMIDRYLETGELYVLMESGQAAAAAVIAKRDNGDWDLMNLATRPDMRGKGYARKLLEHIFSLMASRTSVLYVGTSPANVPFYEHFGFKKDRVIPHYFKYHYNEPIIEDGVPLDDMIRLAKHL